MFVASQTSSNNGCSGNNHTHDEVSTEAQYEDAFLKWNPMELEDSSFYNTFAYDSENPAAIITGEQKVKASQVPCKFYTGNGETCFKAKCVYLHDKQLAKAKQANNEKVAVPKNLSEVILLDELKPKCRAADNTINSGVVVSASNPNNFVIIPHGDWNCACDKETPHQRTREDEFAGMWDFRDMFKDLDYFTLNPTKYSNHYVQNQLVAVKVESAENKKDWYRGVVLKDVVLGESIQAPSVSIRLLDFGSLLVTTTKNVIPMPKQLLRYPPMGYRCSLFGISPIRHQWGKKANDLFKSLVHGQQCMFVIRQMVPPRRDTEVVFETTPYYVDIYVKKKDLYVDVAKHLEEEGLGLAWHPFPGRPKVLKSVLDWRTKCSLLTKMDSSYTSLKPVPHDDVVLLEQQRIKKYLNRTHRFNEPFNSSLH